MDLYVLECKHWTLLKLEDPHSAETLFCEACGCRQVVIAMNPDEITPR